MLDETGEKRFQEYRRRMQHKQDKFFSQLPSSDGDRSGALNASSRMGYEFAMMTTDDGSQQIISVAELSKNAQERIRREEVERRLAASTSAAGDALCFAAYAAFAAISVID